MVYVTTVPCKHLTILLTVSLWPAGTRILVESCWSGRQTHNMPSLIDLMN